MMIERGEEWTWYADFGLVEQEQINIRVCHTYWHRFGKTTTVSPQKNWCLNLKYN